MKDQIQFETNGLTVLAVKVKQGLDNFKVVAQGLCIPYSVKPYRVCIANLPRGKWKYHAVTDRINNEQAKVLVEVNEPISRWENVNDVFYFNYHRTDELDVGSFFCDPIASLRSLLRFHGIDPNEKYVLLIKEI